MYDQDNQYEELMEEEHMRDMEDDLKREFFKENERTAPANIDELKLQFLLICTTISFVLLNDRSKAAVYAIDDDPQTYKNVVDAIQEQINETKFVQRSHPKNSLLRAISANLQKNKDALEICYLNFLTKAQGSKNHK